MTINNTQGFTGLKGENECRHRQAGGAPDRHDGIAGSIPEILRSCEFDESDMRCDDRMIVRATAQAITGKKNVRRTSAVIGRKPSR
jgi:hypothetical protein